MTERNVNLFVTVALNLTLVIVGTRYLWDAFGSDAAIGLLLLAVWVKNKNAAA
jgi:hypothetical protein